ncbi:MAG: hypothetical protein M0Z88_12130, partial [Actinomycetota bacterium]|nr:hypothetical protein [Actinomycetota bacterium]
MAALTSRFRLLRPPPAGLGVSRLVAATSTPLGSKAGAGNIRPAPGATLLGGLTGESFSIAPLFPESTCVTAIHIVARSESPATTALVTGLATAATLAFVATRLAGAVRALAFTTGAVRALAFTTGAV